MTREGDVRRCRERVEGGMKWAEVKSLEASVHLFTWMGFTVTGKVDASPG